MATLKQMIKSKYPNRIIFKYSNGYSMVIYIDNNVKNYKKALKEIDTKSKNCLNYMKNKFPNIKETRRLFKTVYNFEKY